LDARSKDKTPAISDRGLKVVGPPGLEPGTKRLWAAWRNKKQIKLIVYVRSAGVWKQMWNWTDMDELQNLAKILKIE